LVLAKPFCWNAADAVASTFVVRGTTGGRVEGGLLLGVLVGVGDPFGLVEATGLGVVGRGEGMGVVMEGAEVEVALGTVGVAVADDTAGVAGDSVSIDGVSTGLVTVLVGVGAVVTTVVILGGGVEGVAVVGAGLEGTGAEPARPSTRNVKPLESMVTTLMVIPVCLICPPW
jgi:hypothetical protein